MYISISRKWRRKILAFYNARSCPPDEPAVLAELFLLRGIIAGRLNLRRTAEVQLRRLDQLLANQPVLAGTKFQAASLKTKLLLADGDFTGDKGKNHEKRRIKNLQKN